MQFVSIGETFLQETALYKHYTKKCKERHNWTWICLGKGTKWCKNVNWTGNRLYGAYKHTVYARLYLLSEYTVLLMLRTRTGTSVLKRKLQVKPSLAGIQTLNSTQVQLKYYIHDLEGLFDATILHRIWALISSASAMHFQVHWCTNALVTVYFDPVSLNMALQETTRTTMVSNI